MRRLKYLTKNPKKFDEILMLVLNEKFDKEVELLRRDFMKHQPFLLQRGQLTSVRVLRRPEAELDRAIKRMLPKYGLPTTWLDFIKQYVLTNDFVPQDDYDPDGVVLEMKEDSKSKPREVRLILHRRLTKDTVIEAWNKIRKELDISGLKKRKRVPQQFARDYEIVKLRDAGKTWDEVYRVISKKYGDIEYGAMKNAESKMRKRLNLMKK